MTIHSSAQGRGVAYYDAGDDAYHDVDNAAVAYYGADANAEAGEVSDYYGTDAVSGAGEVGDYYGVDAGTGAGLAEPGLPADAWRMIERWRELGCPLIELQPGVVISNLERWLHNNPPASGVRLGRVREYLYVETHGVGAMAA